MIKALGHVPILEWIDCHFTIICGSTRTMLHTMEEQVISQMGGDLILVANIHLDAKAQIIWQCIIMNSSPALVITLILVILQNRNLVPVVGKAQYSGTLLTPKTFLYKVGQAEPAQEVCIITQIVIPPRWQQCLPMVCGQIQFGPTTSYLTSNSRVVVLRARHLIGEDQSILVSAPQALPRIQQGSSKAHLGLLIMLCARQGLTHLQTA